MIEGPTKGGKMSRKWCFCFGVVWMCVALYSSVDNGAIAWLSACVSVAHFYLAAGRVGGNV